MNRHQSVEIAPPTTSSKRPSRIPTSPSSQLPSSPVSLPEFASLAYIKSQFAAERRRAWLSRRQALTTLCSTHDPCAPFDDFISIVQTDSMCTKLYHSLYPYDPLYFLNITFAHDAHHVTPPVRIRVKVVHAAALAKPMVQKKDESSVKSRIDDMVSFHSPDWIVRQKHSSVHQGF